MLHGALITIALTVLTMAIAVPCGIVVAMMRESASSRSPFLATCFVELFRNLPIILVVYWAFYVMPMVLDIAFSPFATGLIALCLNNTAYNSGDLPLRHQLDPHRGQAGARAWA